jgi:hypothetical protein
MRRRLDRPGKKVAHARRPALQSRTRIRSTACLIGANLLTVEIAFENDSDDFGQRAIVSGGLVHQVMLERFAHAHRDFRDSFLGHFRPQKKARHWHEARPGRKFPTEAGRRETRLDGSMSGSLRLILSNCPRGEYFCNLISPQRRHVVAPLVNGRLGDSKRGGQFLDAAERLNGVIRFHAPIISMLNIQTQAYLISLLLRSPHEFAF